jgi:DNA-directed RNA polymerase subunit RPC12/RpoP
MIILFIRTNSQGVGSVPNREVKTKTEAVSTGLALTLSGWGCAPTIGFALLFFTGIGIIGIPFIIIGAIIGFIGFISLIVAIFSKTVKMLCPYCATQNKILANTKTFQCYECKQRVLIKNNTPEKIN